jgi:hypothetical protein
MSFLDLNNDVKSIISKHVLNDNAINKILMTKPNDDLQKKHFDAVQEMDKSLEDVLISRKTRKT